jgi:hypothetical protein
MGELLELLIETALGEPIICAVLLALGALFLCISVMAGVVGSVVGGVVVTAGLILIVSLLLRQSKQPFIALELLRRNESVPADSVASRGNRDPLPSSAHSSGQELAG